MIKTISNVRIEEYICDICGHREIIDFDKPHLYHGKLGYSSFTKVQSELAAVLHDFCPSCADKMYQYMTSLKTGIYR